MERATFKTSTILIGTRRRTRVFRSLKEVPPHLRRKLTESTSGSNSGIILIADRGGRQEILRALSGPRSESGTGARQVASRLQRKLGRVPRTIHRFLPELVIAILVGLVIWLMLASH